jgi:hypothetical protein
MGRSILFNTPHLANGKAAPAGLGARFVALNKMLYLIWVELKNKRKIKLWKQK